MMTRRELESALLTLETTPVLLERLIVGGASGSRPSAARPRIEPLLEAIATREDRLWGRWIDLLISGASPLLPELDAGAPPGAPPWPVLESFRRFRQAREKNLQLLRQTPGPIWDRAGILEKGGVLHLRELPSAMAEGDRRDLDAILCTRALPAAPDPSSPAKPRAQKHNRETGELVGRR